MYQQMVSDMSTIDRLGIHDLYDSISQLGTTGGFLISFLALYDLSNCISARLQSQEMCFPYFDESEPGLSIPRVFAVSVSRGKWISFVRNTGFRDLFSCTFICVDLRI